MNQNQANSKEELQKDYEKKLRMYNFLDQVKDRSKLFQHMMQTTGSSLAAELETLRLRLNQTTKAEQKQTASSKQSSSASSSRVASSAVSVPGGSQSPGPPVKQPGKKHFVPHKGPQSPATGNPVKARVNQAKADKTKRDRSSSRHRTRTHQDNDEALNCQTCMKKYGARIFQCSAGHSSCEDCKSQRARCGVCAWPNAIGDVRNITLEAYIAERTVECPNAVDGCCKTVKVADLDAHLKQCPFKELVCPLGHLVLPTGRCGWRGKLSKLAAHFDSFHPEHRQGAVNTEMLLPNIGTLRKIVHLVEVGPFNFLVHVKTDDKVYMAVQLVGTPTSAARWTYEFHIYNKRDRRTYQYTDVCHSIATPVDNIFAESKCLAIPYSSALSYADSGYCLTYKFFLKKDFGGSGACQRGRGRGHGGNSVSE